MVSRGQEQSFERALGEAKKQASNVADAASNAARETANSFEIGSQRTYREPALYGCGNSPWYRLALRSNASTTVRSKARIRFLDRQHRPCSQIFCDRQVAWRLSACGRLVFAAP